MFSISFSSSSLPQTFSSFVRSFVPSTLSPRPFFIHFSLSFYLLFCFCSSPLFLFSSLFHFPSHSFLFFLFFSSLNHSFSLHSLASSFLHFMFLSTILYSSSASFYLPWFCFVLFLQTRWHYSLCIFVPNKWWQLHVCPLLVCFFSSKETAQFTNLFGLPIFDVTNQQIFPHKLCEKRIFFLRNTRNWSWYMKRWWNISVRFTRISLTDPLLWASYWVN